MSRQGRGRKTELPKLNYGSRRAQIVEWREGGMKKTQAVAPAYNKAGEALLYTHTVPLRGVDGGCHFLSGSAESGLLQQRDVAALAAA